MKAIQAIAVLICLGAASAAIPWAFENCGTESDPMVITGVVLSAIPEKQVSDNITIIGVSNVHGNINLVDINVILSEVKITTLNQAFPQEVDPGDMWIFKYSSYIPSIAPTGTYTIQFVFKDNKQNIQCCTNILMDL